MPLYLDRFLAQFGRKKGPQMVSDTHMHVSRQGVCGNSPSYGRGQGGRDGWSGDIQTVARARLFEYPGACSGWGD